MKNSIKLEHAHSNHKNIFVVNWSLGNTCNYACSYCDSDLNSGSVPWQSFDDIIGFCEEVIKKKRHGKIFFEFTGGEVTRFKDLIPLVKFLSAKNCDVGIISNSSRKIEYWQEIAPYLKHVTLSYHSEYCTPEHYFQVADYLSERMAVNAEIMMHPEHFKKCEELGLRILKEIKSISLSFQALMKNLRSNHQLIDYKPDQMQRLKELYNQLDSHKNENALESHRGLMRNFFSDGTSEEWSPGRFIAEKFNKWAGWLCWTGVEQIVVSSSGDVFNAWCTQVWLGNVKQRNIRFPEYPLVCERSRCHCGLDISATKKKISFD